MEEENQVVRKAKQKVGMNNRLIVPKHGSVTLLQGVEVDSDAGVQATEDGRIVRLCNKSRITDLRGLLKEA